MADQTSIVNRALQKIGERRVSSIDDDVKAAREAKAAWEIVRDAVFRAHPWNCLQERAQLSALTSTPAWGFDSEYQVPDGCLRVLTVDTTLDWKVEGRKIRTDEAAPLNVLYLRDESDTEQYDALLVEALACRLAMELCEPLTQSNTKLAAADQGYRDALKEARRRDAQEGSADRLMRSSWLDSRH